MSRITSRPRSGGPPPGPPAGGTPAQPLPPSATQAFTIQQDTHCLGCGQDLRGLVSTGRCPQCASPIGRSLHGNFLLFAGPHHVRNLAAGVRVLACGLGLYLVLGVVGFVVLPPLSGVLGPAHRWVSLLGTVVLVLVGSLVALAGVWQVTAPEHSRIDPDWEHRRRTLARQAMLAGPPAGVVMMVTLTGFMPAGLPGALAGVLSLALAALYLVGLFSLFRYLARLATRIPDVDLARHAGTVMWGLLAVLGAFALHCVVMALGGAKGLSLSPPCGGLAWFLAFAGSFGWCLMLLCRLRGKLLAQADLAERTWLHAVTGQPGAAPGAEGK